MITKSEWEYIFMRAMYYMQNEDIPRNGRARLKHPERKVTGNLKKNSFKGRWVEENHFVIYMDENIAPYMPYTNEKWTSIKWKGAKNPNENWWQKAMESMVLNIRWELLER